MNQFKKKAAIAQLQDKQFNSKTEFVQTLSAQVNEKDPGLRKFKDDEIEEIFAELYPNGIEESPNEKQSNGETPSQETDTPPSPELQNGANTSGLEKDGSEASGSSIETKAAPASNIDYRRTLQTFYQHKVVPKTKRMRIVGRGEEEILIGYQKVGEPVSTVSITQSHADAHNIQTSNSLMYFFKEGQNGFVPIEEWDTKDSE